MLKILQRLFSQGNYLFSQLVRDISTKFVLLQIHISLSNSISTLVNLTASSFLLAASLLFDVSWPCTFMQQLIILSGLVHCHHRQYRLLWILLNGGQGLKIGPSGLSALHGTKGPLLTVFFSSLSLSLGSEGAVLKF